MPEVAARNLYGYRNHGPNIRTRVRVMAGDPIPPDLVDMEDAPDLERPYANLPQTAATTAPAASYDDMTVKDLEKLVRDRGVEADGTKKADLVAALEEDDSK